MSQSSKEKIEYRCPGETEPISRAVHLARLAAFPLKCRGCAHRSDTANYSPKTAQRLAEVHGEVNCGATFDEEGLAGELVNELTPDVAQQAATAFGLWLREREDTPCTNSDWPTVVLSADGRRLSAPLVAAAARGLRFAGCHVLDVGQATTGCLTLAIAQLRAEGGLAIGSMGHRTHEAALRFWHRGVPLSRGAGLEQLETIHRGHLDRPTRRFGTLRRASFEADYLDSLADFFHALRPLRVVLDTSCQPIVEYLHRLCRSSECRIFDDTTNGATARDLVARHEAHLGVVIDGCGETCRVLDERGEEVPCERIVQLLARYLMQCVENRPGSSGTVSPAVVVEGETTPETENFLADLGCRAVRAEHRRAEMCLTMKKEKAMLAGGPSGRFWHVRSGHVAPDALVTLSLLLVVLSQSDRPLSQVLDETTTTG